MMVLTRRKSSRVHWLLGGEDDKISGNKLPSNRQVLRFFLYNHFTLKKTIRAASHAAIEETCTFWNRARIPSRQKIKCVLKLEGLYKNYQYLLKSRNKPTQGYADCRNAFENSLDNLFDIATADALEQIKEEEDRKFLIAQRKDGRQGCMTSVDTLLARQEAKQCNRIQNRIQRKVEEEDRRKKIADKERIRVEGRMNQDEIMSDAETDCKDKANDENPEPVRKKRRGVGKKITPAMIQLVDRSQCSYRTAAALMNVALASEAATEANVNKSSLQRLSVKHRRDESSRIKASFNASGPYVVHWDGKILQDLQSVKEVDRLAVLITGANFEQLLGVPKLLSGTGFHQAVAVADQIRVWNLTDHISGMSYDTTASNTGPENGACTCLQELLGKKLLDFPCRHHIDELVLKAVFCKCLGPTKGPDNALFSRFRKKWDDIDVSKHSDFLHDEETETSLDEEDARSIVEFCTAQLETHHPTNTYRRLLELSIIFLGGTPPRGIKFSDPGALSNARWMARAVYSLMIYLFRHQFTLTKRELKGLRTVCLFVVRVYLPHWYTTQVPTSAPRSDLDFIRSLTKYADVDPVVSEVALAKFKNHLWYLSEELVPLALFDEDVSDDTKRKMASAFKEKVGSPNPPKKASLATLEKTKSLNEVGLEDFATSNSLRFFEILKLSTGFLEKDPVSWSDDEEYLQALKTSRGLAVVNDSAERGVKLISDSLKAGHTKSEDQLQYLLQIMYKHRKDMPVLTKEAVLKVT